MACRSPEMHGQSATEGKIQGTSPNLPACYAVTRQLTRLLGLGEVVVQTIQLTPRVHLVSNLQPRRSILNRDTGEKIWKPSCSWLWSRARGGSPCRISLFHFSPMMDDGGGRANRVPKRMQTRTRAARPGGLSTLCKETKIARTERSRSATRQALSSFLLQAFRVSHHLSVPLLLPFRACPSHSICPFRRECSSKSLASRPCFFILGAGA